MAERQNKLLLNIEQGTTSEEKAMGRLNLGLATVAATGSYSDLTGKPTIPAAPVQSDWTNNDPSSLAYIQHRPNLATVATTGSYNDLTDTPAPSESPEIVTVIHSQAGETETPVSKLSIDDDFKSVSADNHHIGLLAPTPGTSDHGKMVVVNHDLLDFAEVPNGVPTTSSVDQYLTTNNNGDVEWNIKPICRATESSGGDVDLDICRQIQISRDYANRNETVELVGVGGGSGITEVGVLPPASPAGDKILFTDEYGKVIWDNKYTAGTGITINANNQIAWQYSVGRNLHLNQNRAIQTNIPGGIWNAPTAMSNNFVALSGANFAGAFRLGCRHNVNDKYELALIYTASGMSTTITFIGTETVVGLDNSVTVNQAAYISEATYYTPSNRFGYNQSTIFDPAIHKAIYYSGVAQIGPTSDTKIAIWQDNGTVKISFTSVEVGKVGATN